MKECIKSIWRTIKRMKCWIIISVLFLAGVQILFTIPAPYKWLNAVWGAGDLISFVGTIVLGIVAIMQTKDANDMSQRLMQLEENRYKLEMRPFVILDDWAAFEKDTFKIQTRPDQLYISLGQSDKTMAFCLALALTNTTQSYVSVTYAGARYVDSDKPVATSFSYSNTQNKALRLQPGESKNMIFYGNKEKIIEMFHNKRIRFHFALQNRFGEPYREDFIALVLISEVPTNGIDHFPPYVIISASHYRVGKYTEDPQKIEWERNDGQT